MPITTKQFGKHENVLWVEFGTGDIEFTKSREQDEKHESIMFFKQHEVPHEIGEESDYYIGKSTDEVDGIKLVFKFKKPESITALIHSLTELQKEVFLNNSDIQTNGASPLPINQGDADDKQKPIQEAKNDKK
jgi:hypothetical protein